MERSARWTALHLVVAVSCSNAPSPAPGSPEYDEAVAAFYTGVAAIQVGEDERAERALTRFLELAPREPAAAANLAILAFQQRRYDDARRWIERALSAAPQAARLRILAALVERAQSRLDPAIEHLRLIPESDAAAPRARFLLAQMLEQRSRPGDVAESRRILDTLVEPDSTGPFLLLASARHAARQSDRGALDRAVARLDAISDMWPEPDRALLERIRAARDRPADAGTDLTMLAAALESRPAYAREREALTISEQQPDIVQTELLLLPSPSPRPAAPDLELRWVVRTLDAPADVYRDVRSIWTGEGGPRIALLAGANLWLLTDSGPVQRVPVTSPPTSLDAAATFAAFDFDHDFRLDLAVVGRDGLSLFRQQDEGRFIGVGPASVPARTRTRILTGVWPADTDLDGDVDLVLAERIGPPLILRNRGDDTFTEVARFEGLDDVRDFVWGDVDGDGVPDATFLDAGGRVHVFRNPRQDRPVFVRLASPPGADAVLAIALGDLDSDGRFDLLLLLRDGRVVRASLGSEGWSAQDIARWPGTPDAPARLFLADVDNNGALDAVVSVTDRTRIWLGDSTRTLIPHDSLALTVTALADLTGGGRIEMLGIDSAGRPVRVSSRPSRDYFALTLVPRATDQPGDRRINTFGIGGEAEVRAGMLYQKQPITSPVVHFGIGPNTGVTVARILWPNGTAQAEFDLLASQGRPVIAEQRLKGSCPWLFAFDGRAMQFVTDIAWRTALGLRINAYGSSSVIHSEDRVKIRGDQLVAVDGTYALSITGELWESHFFDHVALLVVDHPAATEVFVDERFTLPPPDPKVHVTALLSPIVQATDGAGRDVTALVEERDGRYVDTFELGAFQGVTRREHFLEIDLGTAPAADGPLLLVAHGWLYPTDGSINFALGQGQHPPPTGVRVDVPDGRGGWTVFHRDLGMPAGKTKTVLIDLAGAFREGGPRRVRLYTNMEIYWDHIGWTHVRPDTAIRVTRVLPDQAELRYRGFSRVRQDGRRAPELPDYVVAGTAPLWADLEGFHTRHGDVRPLLHEVDDRYVIMNAGDEMLLHFTAPAGPPAGWVRDYILVSDAWVKDGDYNNGFSSTLLPLPYHGLSDYARPPGRLEDDPAFRLHPDDWRDYHTRYVTPNRFRHALSQR